MRRPTRFELVVIGLALFASLAGLGVLLYPLGDTSGRPASLAAEAPLIREYCLTCHDGVEQAGDLALDRIMQGGVDEHTEVWERVVRKVRTGMMPPGGEPRPAPDMLDGFAASLEARLDGVAARDPQPGAPTLHRLNRAEYANAIRDLLALEIDAAALLPADDSADGFDNIGDVLGMSPSLVQAYISGAMKISRLAVGDLAAPPSRAVYRAPVDLAQDRHIDGLPLGTRGGLAFSHVFPLDAEYEFRVSGGVRPLLGGGDAGPRPRLVVLLDGKPLDFADPRNFRMHLAAGPHTIGVALVDNRRAAGVDDVYSVYAVGGSVQSVAITGPFDASGVGDSPSRRQIFVCRPEDPNDEDECAERILTKVASRAFRAPIVDPANDLATIMHFYREGRAEGTFHAGIQRALARVLVDPRFLYRFEREPDDLAPGSVYRIADLELASRLSFFLWSSIPDERLLEIAGRGELRDRATLEREVRRMLDDPRADSLVQNFAGQWLRLRELDNAEPDVPEFDDNLRQAFRRETELLFASVIREDASVLELLDADYTFVDERLARHYGIPDVRGSYVRRVQLPKDSPRRGVLGHGSVLTVTSVANRTSPVVRGSFVLESLLGSPPPLPPPGVETDLDQKAAGAPPASLRERLEMHRANPTCAACHRIMDPIGLALENFDHVGRWRDADAGGAIDPSGRLVDGTPVDGPAGLRAALLAKSDAFVTTFTEKLLTYALGRGVEHYDQPTVRKVVREAARDDYRFSSLIVGIATSVPFQMRVKAEAAATVAAVHNQTSESRAGEP